MRKPAELHKCHGKGGNQVRVKKRSGRGKLRVWSGTTVDVCPIIFSFFFRPGIGSAVTEEASLADWINDFFPAPWKDPERGWRYHVFGFKSGLPHLQLKKNRTESIPTTKPNPCPVPRFFPPPATQVRNDWSKQCVDSPVKSDDMHKPVGLWPCHEQGGNQVSHSSIHGTMKPPTFLGGNGESETGPFYVNSIRRSSTLFERFLGVSSTGCCPRRGRSAATRPAWTLPAPTSSSTRATDRRETSSGSTTTR